MFEYVGAIHIHSTFSDGSGEVPEIVQLAGESGLDYIILTDHNTLRALNEGFERWYDKTLLLVGYEVNDKQNKNHYLALRVKETVSTRLPAIEYVKKIKDAGGIGFIAHPNEKRSSMKEHPPYPWTEWSSQDFTGIEIWNHMSEWMEGLTEQNKYNYFIHPLKSIVSPPTDTLEIWDQLNQKRKVVGIGGIDAHAHKVNVFGFMEMEIFPYKVLFKSIRTHVLCEEVLHPSVESHEFSKAKKNIYDALVAGRCFVSNSYHGDARGFQFYAEGNGKIFQMGDLVPLSKDLKLVALAPTDGCEIRLIQNGKPIIVYKSIKNEFIIKEKGVYRVEIYKGKNAWIFSNHIRIGL